MERIPTEYKDPKTAKILDLTIENLPMPATFIADCIGLQIGLVESEHFYNQALQKDERKPGTGCNVKFRGGNLLVKNKTILQLLMSCDTYLRGQCRIDPSDPTGFWRATGKIQVKTVKVAVFDGASHPGFDDLDISTIKAPVEKVEPLRAVG